MKILAFRGKSLVSKAIRFFTRSEYSHVAVELDDGRVVEAWHVGGVLLHPSRVDLENAHTRNTPVEVLKFVTEPDDGRRYLMEHFLLAQVGKRYDWLDILRFVTRERADDDDRWFCSELLQAMAQRGGVPLQRIEAWRCSPRDVAMSPVLEYESEFLL